MFHVPAHKQADPRKAPAQSGSAPLASRPSAEVRSIEALQKILTFVQEYDAALDDEDQDGGPQPPDGDDYNEIVDYVRYVATEALHNVAEAQAAVDELKRIRRLAAS